MLPIAIYRQHIDIDIDFDVFDILLLINFVCLTTKVLNVGFPPILAVLHSGPISYDIVQSSKRIEI